MSLIKLRIVDGVCLPTSIFGNSLKVFPGDKREIPQKSEKVKKSRTSQLFTLKGFGRV